MGEDARTLSVSHRLVGRKPDGLRGADDGLTFWEGEDIGEEEGAGDGGDCVVSDWGCRSRGERDCGGGGGEQQRWVVVRGKTCGAWR